MAIGPRKTSGGSRACRDSVLTWEEVTTTTHVEPEEVPPGWITSDQFAAMKDISTVHACHTLNELARKGFAERRKFRIRKEDGGRVYPVWHYKRLK